MNSLDFEQALNCVLPIVSQISLLRPSLAGPEDLDGLSLVIVITRLLKQLLGRSGKVICTPLILPANDNSLAEHFLDSPFLTRGSYPISWPCLFFQVSIVSVTILWPEIKNLGHRSIDR